MYMHSKQALDQWMLFQERAIRILSFGDSEMRLLLISRLRSFLQGMTRYIIAGVHPIYTIQGSGTVTQPSNTIACEVKILTGVN